MDGLTTANNPTKAFGKHATIIILERDNSNETAWLDSVIAIASAIGAMKFLLAESASSRPATQADFADNKSYGMVKKEPGENDERKVAVRADPNDINSYVPPAQAQMDVIKKMMNRKLRIFLDTDGTDEDRDDHTRRFYLYVVIKQSLPYHLARICACQPGNCYQILTVVATGMKVTGLSLFNIHRQLFTAVTFTKDMAVADLARIISDIVAKAGHVTEGGFHKEVIRGCLLHSLKAKPEFDGLRKDFSLSTCKLGFHEMVTELQGFEMNNELCPSVASKDNVSYTDDAQSISSGSSSSNGSTSSTSSVEQAIAMLARHVTSGTHGQARNRAPRGGDVRSQVCRNYQAGRCSDPCPAGRKHEDKPARGQDRQQNTAGGAPRGITCYNCMTVCGNIAKNCTRPRAPLPARPRETAHAAGEQRGDQLSMRELLAVLNGSPDDGPVGTSTERGYMLQEVSIEESEQAIESKQDSEQAIKSLRWFMEELPPPAEIMLNMPLPAQI